MNNLKSFCLISAAVAISQLCFAFGKTEKEIRVEGYAYHDINANGKFDDGDMTLKGIYISNGKDIVTTNDKGYYSITYISGRPTFVIKPSGWQLAAKEYQHPAFYYIPRNEGKSIQHHNFGFIPQKEDRAVKVALFGDPQPHNIDEVYDFIRTTVDESKGKGFDFSVTLGDLAGPFNPVLKAAIGNTGKTSYYVMGNHDIAKKYSQHNQEVDADREYEASFGPTYYGFAWGSANFLVFNSNYPAQYINGKEYITDIDSQQFEFIKNYIATLNKEQLLVVFSHDYPQNLKNRNAFYSLFKGFDKVAFICGHLHTVEQHYITQKDGWPNVKDTHWFSAGATCGGHWRGERDIFGIPAALQKDGTPKGYAFMEINPDGNFTYRYKCSGLDENLQMHIFTEDYRLFDPLFSPENELKRDVYANVYLGNERSVVKMRVDDGEWVTMNKVEETDPYILRIMKQQKAGRFPTEGNINLKNYSEKSFQCQHLWHSYYSDTLKPGIHQIEIQVQGDFGLNVTTFHTILIPSEAIKAISVKADKDYKKWAAPGLLK